MKRLISFDDSDISTEYSALRANGVAFLQTPASYHDASLRDLNILVDRDDLGYVLQIFTKPPERENL